MRRALVSAVIGAIAVIAVAACEPQMQISPVLNRDALLHHGTSEELTVVGTIRCTRDEPVDLFPTITQGARTDRPGELSVPCGPKTTTYTVTFTNVAPGFVNGDSRISIDYCTNPAEPIDEDCVTVSRVVKLHVV